MKRCRVLVLGAGYVGLVTAACLAEIGHRVTCLDVDKSKIARLNQGGIPIYEPGLAEIVGRNLGKQLEFTTSYKDAVPKADIAIIAVGTPPGEDGDAELKYVWQVADSLIAHIEKPIVVAVKSTVPVGVCDELEVYLNRHLGERLGASASAVPVLSNPEFLREGRAVSDFMQADRVVIGGHDEPAIEALKEVYAPLQVPIVIADRRSSELIKYASNAFLATKISFINSIGHLCERLGADVVKVAEGMGYDHRIKPEHLRAGLGYGGSCFPKDTMALLATSNRVDYDFEILAAAVRTNERQVDWVFDKLERALGTLVGKSIAVWGIAFKPSTDDTRDSQAVKVVRMLLAKEARVRAHDPAARFPADSSSSLFSACKDKYEAVKDADALVLATEWPEFLEADFDRVRSLMRKPLCVDARNCLIPETMRSLGFAYEDLGRSVSEELRKALSRQQVAVTLPRNGLS